MTHTAKLVYLLCPAFVEIEDFCKAFRGLQDTKFYGDDKGHVNNSLRDYGISSIRLTHDSENEAYWLSLIVNFAKVINPDDYQLKILRTKDVPIFEAKFNALLNGLSPDLPSFDNWGMSRIDYCYDIVTNNEEYVKEYTRILRKSSIPYSYHKSKREESSWTDNLYLQAKSARINFYDKYEERKNNCKQDNIQFILDQAESQGILRIEYQCFAQKTRRIRRKYDIANISCNFLNDKIASDTLFSILNRITKDADYQRKSVALQMIDDMPRVRQKTKRNMKIIVEEVAKQKCSIDSVRKKLVEENVMTATQFDACLNKMAKANINAVTIPDSRGLPNKTGKQGLPSIQKMLREAIEQERRSPE